MNGNIYLNDLPLGHIAFKIIDESMGVIGGALVFNENYQIVREDIQRICEKKGIANVDDFSFSIQLDNGTILNPEGGIGVTDLAGVEEVYVEVAGLDADSLDLFG